MSSINNNNADAEENVFKLRIVDVDYYMSKPISGLDESVSRLRGTQIDYVPVIRIFGTTHNGHKCCLHVHQVYPYMCVPLNEIKDGNEDDKYCHRKLANELERTLNKKNANNNYVSGTQFVHDVVQIEAKPFYGFHEDDHSFMKIEFYNPSSVQQSFDLFHNGSIMKRVIQPYQAHIPFILQFFIDYNLYGMNFITASNVHHRKSFDSHSYSIHQSQGDVHVDAISSCQIECDIKACDIFNRNLLQASDNTNPGLQAILEDIDRYFPEERRMFSVPSQKRECHVDENEKRQLERLFRMLGICNVTENDNTDDIAQSASYNRDNIRTNSDLSQHKTKRKQSTQHKKTRNARKSESSERNSNIVASNVQSQSNEIQRRVNIEHDDQENNILLEAVCDTIDWQDNEGIDFVDTVCDCESEECCDLCCDRRSEHCECDCETCEMEKCRKIPQVDGACDDDSDDGKWTYKDDQNDSDYDRQSKKKKQKAPVKRKGGNAGGKNTGGKKTKSKFMDMVVFSDDDETDEPKSGPSETRNSPVKSSSSQPYSRAQELDMNEFTYYTSKAGIKSSINKSPFSSTLELSEDESDERDYVEHDLPKVAKVTATLPLAKSSSYTSDTWLDVISPIKPTVVRSISPVLANFSDSDSDAGEKNYLELGKMNTFLKTNDLSPRKSPVKDDSFSFDSLLSKSSNVIAKKSSPRTFRAKQSRQTVSQKPKAKSNKGKKATPKKKIITPEVSEDSDQDLREVCKPGPKFAKLEAVPELAVKKTTSSRSKKTPPPKKSHANRKAVSNKADSFSDSSYEDYFTKRLVKVIRGNHVTLDRNIPADMMNKLGKEDLIVRKTESYLIVDELERYRAAKDYWNEELAKYDNPYFSPTKSKRIPKSKGSMKDFYTLPYLNKKPEKKAKKVTFNPENDYDYLYEVIKTRPKRKATPAKTRKSGRAPAAKSRKQPVRGNTRRGRPRASKAYQDEDPKPLPIIPFEETELCSNTTLTGVEKVKMLKSRCNTFSIDVERINDEELSLYNASYTSFSISPFLFNDCYYSDYCEFLNEDTPQANEVRSSMLEVVNNVVIATQVIENVISQIEEKELFSSDVEPHLAEPQVCCDKQNGLFSDSDEYGGIHAIEIEEGIPLARKDIHSSESNSPIESGQGDISTYLTKFNPDDDSTFQDSTGNDDDNELDNNDHHQNDNNDESVEQEDEEKENRNENQMKDVGIQSEFSPSSSSVSDQNSRDGLSEQNNVNENDNTHGETQNNQGNGDDEETDESCSSEEQVLEHQQVQNNLQHEVVNFIAQSQQQYCSPINMQQQYGQVVYDPSVNIPQQLIGVNVNVQQPTYYSCIETDNSHMIHQVTGYVQQHQMSHAHHNIAYQQLPQHENYVPMNQNANPGMENIEVTGYPPEFTVWNNNNIPQLDGTNDDEEMEVSNAHNKWYSKNINGVLVNVKKSISDVVLKKLGNERVTLERMSHQQLNLHLDFSHIQDNNDFDCQRKATTLFNINNITSSLFDSNDVKHFYKTTLRGQDKVSHLYSLCKDFDIQLDKTLPVTYSSPTPHSMSHIFSSSFTIPTGNFNNKEIENKIINSQTVEPQHSSSQETLIHSHDDYSFYIHSTNPSPASTLTASSDKDIKQTSTPLNIKRKVKVDDSPLNKNSSNKIQKFDSKRVANKQQQRLISQDIYKPSTSKTIPRSSASKPTKSRKLRSNMSVIEGPTLTNTYDFDVKSIDNLLSSCEMNKGDSEHTSLHEFQYLTIMSLEVLVSTRKNLKPDPERDNMIAAFYSVHYDSPSTAHDAVNFDGVIIVRVDHEAFHVDNHSSPNIGRTSQLLTSHPRIDKLKIDYAVDEIDLLMKLVKIVKAFDPDIIIGFEIESLSWGYVFKRSEALNLNIMSPISRIVNDFGGNINMSKYKNDYKVIGRISLNIWRILRSEEAKLRSYSYENVHYQILHERVPFYDDDVLKEWFCSSFNTLDKWRVIDYYLIRTRGSLRMLNKLDIITKTSELARLFGIQFIEVFSRGSQFRVESMMLRATKSRNLIAISPSPMQRSRMKAPESLPLVMEPESNLYTDPVAVLDFQSLYPSIIISNNYCYSTCLGRVENLVSNSSNQTEFGCGNLYVPKEILEKYKKSIHISPNGIAFVKKNIREGILPKMLQDILNTRIMVKNCIKTNNKRDKPNSALNRMFDARQLGLKLIANVTYGYTSANFSGRMPNVDIADAIVSKGRETLEKAIQLVQKETKWLGKVIYGDTDSTFILFPGCTKDEAFKRGMEIAEAVTALNPKPVKLKFEKIYQPCVLETKKRYVGFMFESINQTKPDFDAKGIETVRRDSCPAVAKMLEKSLRILFTTNEVNKVKDYLLQQFQKIVIGRISMLDDFIFAREYRGINNYSDAASVPSLEIAKRRIAKDAKSEPKQDERVPYVIICGAPDEPITQLVREPIEMIKDPSLRLNSTYYIERAIIPALNRVFKLIGHDVLKWYQEMPRINIPKVSNKYSLGARRARTMSQHFATANCVVCKNITGGRESLCKECKTNKQSSAVNICETIRASQLKYAALTELCKSCNGSNDNLQKCVSIDCPNLFRYSQAKRDISHVSQLNQVLKSLSF